MVSLKASLMRPETKKTMSAGLNVAVRNAMRTLERRRGESARSGRTLKSKKNSLRNSAHKWSLILFRLFSSN